MGTASPPKRNFIVTPRLATYKVGTSDDSNPHKMNFKSILQVDIPLGRVGKHREIVNRLLNDLEHLEAGRALKIPIQGLQEPMESVRADYPSRSPEG